VTARAHPRVPNLALRQARQSMRMSQAQFAEAVVAAGNAMGVPNRCTKRLVQKWETGEHATCKPNYIRVLQAVTGLSARELGFRILPDGSGQPTSGPAEAPDGADSSPPGAEAAYTPTARTAKPKIPQDDADATAEASIDRIRHSLAHPKYIDAHTAGFVETTTARLFELEHHIPARLLAPTVDRHLATVSTLLTIAQRSNVRRRLTISAGYGTLLAGLLAFDRGDTPAADRLWETTIDTAEATQDAALLTAALTYSSYAAARRKDPDAAWQLAYRAKSHTDDARAIAWTASRIALYAAQLNEREAAETAMKLSLESGAGLPKPQPGDDTTPWTRSFDAAALFATTAHTAALLNDPNAADYATRAVKALGSANVKARAVALAELALTAAIIGELRLCLDHSAAAARLTRDLEVSHAADLLCQIPPLLLSYSDTRTAREILLHLKGLRRTTDLQTEHEAATSTRTEATVENPQ
jgi:transcriptional regulator with XRE-family HTH domain